MNDDLLKELSRLQLLTSRYNSKSKMCPFEIKKEEVKAKLIFDYIKQLQQENKELDKYKNIVEDIKKLMNKDQCGEYCYMEVADYLLELENVGDK